MWYAAIIRFVRRRLVLGLVFASSLTYCVLSLLKESNHSKRSEQDIPFERKHPFIWRTLQEVNETSDNISCRNSLQGKLFVVDERGVICKRSSVMRNGCCDADSIDSSRYNCNTCGYNRCCIEYENCVSCCLNPSKKDILQIVLDKLIAQESVLFNTVSDHYELCLAKCRTNSLSVQHENTYRDASAKYCYGETPPGTERTVDKRR